MPSVLRLGVNIDHVATVRNARGGARPDPVRAALLAIEAGADGITAHLREDRRHIRDEDIIRLKAEITKPLNFEMAATADMLAIALKTSPHAVCLVPEKREERTTEGGLDVIGGHDHLFPIIAKLNANGARVSLFIEPDRQALDMALKLKAPVVELHTGTWCEAVVAGEKARAEAELERLLKAASYGKSAGLEIHAGHGLDVETAEILAASPDFHEFNIGHFLIGEAIFIGLGESIRQMRAAMDRGRAAINA
jgi:pyridoxine 5-phosphate synthase